MPVATFLSVQLPDAVRRDDDECGYARDQNTTDNYESLSGTLVTYLE